MSVKFHEAYCLDSQQDQLLWWDDFLGDQLQDEWSTFFVGAGTAIVVDQQTGGIVRITTGALTNNESYIRWGNIRSLLISKRLSAEFRVKANQTTQTRINLALWLTWNELVDFRVSSAGAPANWFTRCISGGAGAPGQDTGIAVDTNYHIFRIECHTHGANHVHFYIDGTETAGSPISTNITASYLQPFLYINTSEDVAKSMDIDYCVVRQDV